MSEISFILVDEEIPILKHFCRCGQKSSQTFLIFIIEVDIISIFSIKGKTNVSNWRVRPVHRGRESVSLLRRSRKAPATTSVNKQSDKQSPWIALETLKFSRQGTVYVDSKLGVRQQESDQTDFVFITATLN